MASSVQHFLHHSLIFWLTLLVTCLPLTEALTVHLNYTSPKVKGDSMPDELNITVSGGSVAPTYVHLRLAQHATPNVPVYTIGVDQSGEYFNHLEKLEDKKNIGFYQDVSSEAVIQVTRIDGRGDNETRFKLKGEIKIEGQKFILSHEGRSKRETSLLSSPQSPSEDVEYTLIPQNRSTIAVHDYIEAPPQVELKIVESAHPKLPDHVSLLSRRNTSSSSSKPRRRRRQSRTVQSIIIDVAAVADYASYRRFLASSSSRSEALQAMREYYSFIFSGVDLRYKGIVTAQYTISVRLIKLIVAETSATSEFTENFRRSSSSPWDKIDAEDALKAFSAFAADSGYDRLFPYDHAMLFTGYDLTSRRNGDVSNSTTGLAYTSTLCQTDGKSVSLVEDLGGFQCVDTAAHELGHSFSAKHDGDGNNCWSRDRFIMSEGGYQSTPSNKLNPWLFSSCSITAFNNYINNKLETERGKKCLLEQLSTNGVTEVSNRLPGQEFSPDNQCRMIYGNASRVCRGDNFAAPSDICTMMFCYNPSTKGTCFGQKAAMGTTCGNGKMCLNGQCVSDPRAPAVDDNCVFGDQPGIAFDGQTCPDFVNKYNGYCYQTVVRDTCCQSCKTVYKDVDDCEYGDTASGCSASICRFVSANTLSQCCRTCASSTTSGSAGTRIAGIRGQSSSPSTRPSVRQPIQGRQTPTTASSSQCVDNPNILINGQSCSSAIRSNPSFCSIANVQDLCCSSCNRVSSSTRG